MIGLLQRVSRARIEVSGECVATIGRGLLVLIGIEKEDGTGTADRLLERVLAYRVFPDAAGRMNLSLTDVGGDLLLVPQFTLLADTTRGNRPGFERAAAPALSQAMFRHLVARAEQQWPRVGAGRFGADMEVELVNSGPVTFLVRVAP